MKKLAVLLFLSVYSLTALAQDAGKITGVWWNEDKTTKIQVELKDGKYIGTIIYMIPEKYEKKRTSGKTEPYTIRPRARLMTALPAWKATT